MTRTKSLSFPVDRLERENFRLDVKVGMFIYSNEKNTGDQRRKVGYGEGIRNTREMMTVHHIQEVDDKR